MSERDEVVLITDLDETECLRRLRGVVDEERSSFFSLSGYAGSKRMIGKFDAKGIRLRVRKVSRFRLWLPYFCGRLNQEMHRTRIEGRFTVSRTGLVYMRLIQVVLIGGGAFFLFVWWTPTERAPSPQISLIILIVLLLGILFPRLSRPMARDNEKRILEFLQNTLVAQIEPRP